ncbi:MAG: glycoside hydrolase family 25 protein [Bacteriovorax sp.]
MKQAQRQRTALISPRNHFLTLVVLLNVFASSYSYASGSKMPAITNNDSAMADPPGSASPSPAGGVTTAPSTGGGTATKSSTTSGGGASATQSAFNRPWTQSETSIVIDAYSGNSIDWNKMATDKKVVAVVHRSSIGTQVDSQYQARKKIALERGYLWGAYHLGKRGNTIAQANLFLSLVKDEPNTLMILDLEDTSSGNFMSIDEAVVFMNYIHEKTGRIPVIYANDSTTKMLNQKVKNNPLLQQSKLWYARFKGNITDFPAGIWPNYFLWQFSCELNCSSTGSCLYNVPGTKFDMDVNVFYGSARELAAQWNND